VSVEDELCNGFDHATWLLGSLIYILALDDEVQYVGRSNNFLVRLFKHRGTLEFNRVYVKSVPRDLASAEEARLIRELQPALNIASTTRVKRRTQAEIAEQARALLIVSGLKMDRRRF
jgi:predicted GIY-YIG superfamily endonuclease